jgi:hypothetical protein
MDFRFWIVKPLLLGSFRDSTVARIKRDAGRTHLVNKGGITDFIENIVNWFALIENLNVYI